MEDTLRHKGLRKRLVEHLKEKGIQDKNVLNAISHIPRHFFLDKAFEEHAYDDKAFPIDAQQTISQPFTVAFQTQLLSPQKREKILEIGTGSGYQSCVLAALGARVYTVERHETLHLQAKKMFERLGFLGIRSYFRDGMKGLGEFAPFDKIIVTAGAKQIPEALTQQLKIGGHLVIPQGAPTQTMFRLTKLEDGTLHQETYGQFQFVPLLKGKKNYS